MEKIILSQNRHWRKPYENLYARDLKDQYYLRLIFSINVL